MGAGWQRWWRTLGPYPPEFSCAEAVTVSMRAGGMGPRATVYLSGLEGRELGNGIRVAGPLVIDGPSDVHVDRVTVGGYEVTDDLQAVTSDAWDCYRRSMEGER